MRGVSRKNFGNVFTACVTGKDGKMTEIEIGKNEAEQRLDRFLRKYLKEASLSYIYKIIRKDVKVNGRRVPKDTMLSCGDRVFIYLSEEELGKFRQEKAERKKMKRQFGIAYEDENILIAEKPFGLLTHGDRNEKKNTLVNQVTDYLIEKGEYIPRVEKSFSPAAVNRLDRNTTGLVIFGKNSASLRDLNEMIRNKSCIGKYYLTIVCGELKHELHLTGSLSKDSTSNKVTVHRGNVPEDEKRDVKSAETIARPIFSSGGYTLAEVQLMTGRTHQIRAHLASAGYPVIGDAKYGNSRENRKIASDYGLTTQFLHAYMLKFYMIDGVLSYLDGLTVRASLSDRQRRIAEKMFGSTDPVSEYIGI